jgi:hypothetical protein
MWRTRLIAALLFATALACSGGNPPLGDGGTPVTQDGGSDGGVDGGPDAGPIDTTDSDGDGLPNAVEDANHNGRVDTGETDPNKVDSDCDGLIDGPSRPADSLLGEDQNADGKVGSGETDPRKADSDQDGLTDGVERGVSTAPDPTCSGFVADGDPGTTTDATDPDSDGDGILDGTEDSDHDGQVDPGETSPEDGGDADSPTGEACAADRLRPVMFRGSNGAHLRVGLPGNFAEVQAISLGGTDRGLIGYDAQDQVAFVAYTVAAPGGDASADEAAVRASINSVASLSLPSTQTFTTWDDVGAVNARYTQSGSVDLKARANALANKLVGAGAGLLTGNAGVGGPFQLQVEVAHRSADELAVVVALAPTSKYDEEATFFSVGDTAGGSALANFTDSDQVQCESFTSHPAKVDFLFVVDDSGSMSTHQGALASAGDAVAAKLNNAYLDWRIALVGSDYHITGENNSGVIRGFTRNIEQVKAWLLEGSTCTANGNTACSLPGTNPTCDPAGGANGGCWLDQDGSGHEGVLGAGRKALDDLSPASATEVSNKVRQGAQVVVVILSDSDDQTDGYTSTNANCGNDGDNGCTVEDVQHFIKYFQNDSAGTAADHSKNPLAMKVPVNGIVFPPDGTCGGSGEPKCEYQADPQRHAAVISATGGIMGDIQTTQSVTSTIDLIVDNAINSAGHVLSKPPIGASIKVVLDGVEDTATCPKADPADQFYAVPRSRNDGFDFDGVSGKLSFFGGCRPKVPDVTRAAVSYRYWDLSGTCPADCGGCPDGYFCSQVQCACVTVN